MIASETVAKIKLYIELGHRDGELARAYQISRHSVAKIRLGRTHAHVKPARSVPALSKEAERVEEERRAAENRRVIADMAAARARSREAALQAEEKRQAELERQAAERQAALERQAEEEVQEPQRQEEERQAEATEPEPTEPTTSEPEKPAPLESLSMGELEKLLDGARQTMRACEEAGDAEGKLRAAQEVNALLKAQREVKAREVGPAC